MVSNDVPVRPERRLPGRPCKAWSSPIRWCAITMHTAAAFACANAGKHTSALTAGVVAVPGSPVARQPGQVVLSPDGEYLAYTLDDSLWVAPVSGVAATHAVAGGVRGEASSPFPMLAWSPDARSLLYRSGNGVGDAGTSGGEVRFLDLSTPGASEPFFPDSLQRTLRTFQNFLAGGPAWSPDGRYVAILAVRQGDPQYGLQVYVADLRQHSVSRWTAEGRRRWSIAWSPDSRWLAVASGEFTAQGASIELLDAARRGADPRVAYQAPTALLRRLLWSPDGRLLLAQDRGGKAYLVAIDTGGAATTVPHQLPAASYAAWLPGDTALIATVSDRMSNRVVRISLSSGASRYLTGPDTNATAVGLVRTGTGTPRLIHRMESGSIPPDIWSSPLDGAVGAPRDNITRTNVGVAASQLPRTTIYQWSRGDGSPGLAQLLLPRSGKSAGAAVRLPLVVIPYGGYSNSFPRSEYFLDEGILSLTAAGYAVVKPNTRGRASESDDGARYGAVQLEDTELLLDALVRDGTIDPRRVATIGHSHGGAMAYYYLTHSTRFCAVVAANGRADWILQARHPDTDGVLPGALGGTPDSLPERYREFSPVANARRATAPLLAVAGDLDTQILAENVTIMGDSMRAAGKVVETIRFPDEGHLLLKPEHRRLFWGRVFRLLRGAC
jgi:dipeptidyl aminopeptidase/acylaminoacyl peptidase